MRYISPRILPHVVNVCLAPWFLTIENNCLCPTSSLPPASAPVMPSSQLARDNELLLVSCLWGASMCFRQWVIIGSGWKGKKKKSKIIVVTVIFFGCHGNCRLSLFMLSCLIQGFGNELNTDTHTHPCTHARMDACTHARTHARTRTRTYPQIHTHTELAGRCGSVLLLLGVCLLMGILYI